MSGLETLLEENPALSLDIFKFLVYEAGARVEPKEKFLCVTRNPNVEAAVQVLSFHTFNAKQQLVQGFNFNSIVYDLIDRHESAENEKVRSLIDELFFLVLLVKDRSVEQEFEGKVQELEGLFEGDKVVWSKEKHKLFPESHRKRIEAFLVSSQVFLAKRNLKLPKPLFGMIVSFSFTIELCKS